MNRWQSVVFSFLSLILGSAASAAEPVIERNVGEIHAKAALDRDSVTLSGQIVLTLTVEGPARLEVTPPVAPEATPPRRLLTEASLQSWSVNDKGLPLVEILDGNRQLWSQAFVLRPFKEGPKIEIALAPLKVKAGNSLEVEINWPGSVAIPVTTSIRNPDLQQLRTITDVESPVVTPIDPRGQQHWLVVLVVAIGTVLTLLVVLILARRSGTREPASSHGAGWALSEFDALTRSGLAGAAAFARISEVLRQFLEHRFDLPATRLTTAELLDSLRQNKGFTGTEESELLGILVFCDVTKFAGTFADHSGPADVAEWCERAIQFVIKTKPVEPVDSVQSAIS